MKDTCTYFRIFPALIILIQIESTFSKTALKRVRPFSR